MAEEMKTTPAPEEQRPEPPAPETPDAPAPLRPEALTVEEQLILEHEGRAALFEMGEVFPDVPEFPGVATLEPPSPEQGSQAVIPGMEGPPPGRTTGRSPYSPGAGGPPCRGSQPAPGREDCPAPPAREAPASAPPGLGLFSFLLPFA